ncbi:hypothetical protein [Arthrobacter sp.]|nr:hypothetical protein [Arthrobacter sp.]
MARVRSLSRSWTADAPGRLAALGGLAGAGTIVSGLLLWADAWGF